MKKKTIAITIVCALLAVGLVVGSLYSGFSTPKDSVVGNENCVKTNNPNTNIKECNIFITHAGGYSPDTFTVNKGDTVRFLATTAEPAHMHGITIDGYGINEVINSSNKNSPQVIEFVANQSGVFTMWCKPCLEGPYGDHQWMKGNLIVR